MADTQRKRFGFITLWSKGALAKMIEQFEPQEGIALSGSFDIKHENIEAFAEFLSNLPVSDGGYVRADLAAFFSDADKPGDFKGSIQEPYKKEGGSTGGGRTQRQLRSL